MWDETERARRYLVVRLAEHLGRRKMEEDPVAKEEVSTPSARIVLDVLISERTNQRAEAGELNILSTSLLGFEAVVATIAIAQHPHHPIVKYAALAALGFSMVLQLVALYDLVGPPKRGLWKFNVAELAQRVTEPEEHTELVLVATTMEMIIRDGKNIVDVKRRMIGRSYRFLIAAILLGIIAYA